MSNFKDKLKSFSKDTLKTVGTSTVAGMLRKIEMGGNAVAGDSLGSFTPNIGMEFDGENTLFDNLASGENIKPKSNSTLNQLAQHSGVNSQGDIHDLIQNNTDDNYQLTLPRWGYEDFINERNIFVKRLSNGLDEPNWFYFKIFFNFNTHNGLFGGIMNDNDKDTSLENFSGTNSAMKYFQHLYNSGDLYKNQNQILDKAICLNYFTHLLSYISTASPWFFKGIKGLSEASNIQQNYSTERFIEIDLSYESVDMRLSTLLSLYKYACFDDMFHTETLPSNLRKFDMCILVFSSPIKIFHTPIKSANTNQVYRDRYKYIYSNFEPSYVNQGYGSNMMSFKLYKFMNCEISKDSLGIYMPSQLSNEAPFQLGGQSLKIKYDRVYEYLNNEYMGIMFGSDGLYNNAIDLSINTGSSIDDILVTASEDFIHNNISSLLGPKNQTFVLGNIFHQDRSLYGTDIGTGFAETRNSKNINEYAGKKFGTPYRNSSSIFNSLKKIAFNSAYKALGVGYQAQGDLGLNSMPIINSSGQFVDGDAQYKLSIDGSNKILSGYHGLQNSNSIYDDQSNKFLDFVGKVQNFNLGSYLNNKITSKVKPFKFLR